MGYPGPATVPLRVKRGTSWCPGPITYYNPDGTPANLTGWACSWKVYLTNDPDTDRVELADFSPYITVAGSDGLGTILPQVPVSVINSLPMGSLFHECILSLIANPSINTFSPMEGPFEVYR